MAYENELAPIRSMLEPDGFALDVVDDSGGSLDLRLYTTASDACGDCVVPKAVMTRLIDEQLRPHGLTVRDIAYPEGSGH